MTAPPYRVRRLGVGRVRQWDDMGVKTRIQCPCGQTIVGKDEDDLVELTNAHLKEQHDGRTYDREMILMMAT